jgi:UDP-N-acetylmuramoylalanine--D-glutamate ligase
MSPPAPVATRSDLAGRRVVVLGLARSGVAAARMLADAGAEVTVYDRRSHADLTDAVESLGKRPVGLALAAASEDVTAMLGRAELVVTSPSISPRFPTTDAWLQDAMLAAEAAGVEVVSEIELFLRLTRARILAVTGTKGKTTTTAMIGSILDAGGVPHAVGGNIGTPLIERADTLGPDEWAVLELSELQLPTISRGADVAVYTNIGADHLDRHGSVEAYRAVKARLAELSTGRGTVVLNADDAGCRTLGESLAGGQRWYGFDDRSLQATVEDGRLYLGGRELMLAADVPLPGRHMLSDAMAAALGASLAGAGPDAVAAGIRGFHGVPHRLEILGDHGGVTYVNDSQATIPPATLAALEAFVGRGVVLIAGGRGKGLDYAELADAITTRCRAAVLIGESAASLEELIGGRIPVERADDMRAAVARATAIAHPGEVVLLSPAAASFDMFADYAARGEAFRQAVFALREATR